MCGMGRSGTLGGTFTTSQERTKIILLSDVSEWNLNFIVLLSV